MIALKHLLMIPAVFSIKMDVVEQDNKLPILEKYVGYQIIVHYDNLTYNDVDLFLDIQSVNFTAILTFNYDVNIGCLRRPTGYKFLNIVLLTNPFDFERFSVGNLKHEDVVIFIVKNLEHSTQPNSNYQLRNVWTQGGLDNGGSVIVYDMCKNDFYHVKFYFGNTSGIANKIAVEREGTFPDLARYVNEFKDFNGHVFYVAYYPYAPFIWCESEILDGPGCNVKGIEGNILLLLSKYLNFTFVMKYPEIQTSGSIWREMIEEVHYGRRDWTVGGISISSERSQLADFTTMLHMEGYITFYVSQEIGDNTWNGILRPFKLAIWIQLLIDILCIGIIFKFVAVVYNVSRSYHFGDSVFIPFHVIVEQSLLPNLRIRLLNLKLILSLWFLMSIIITTAYKSKLASTMIMPAKREPSSILNLYDEGYSFQVNNEDWTVLKENLQHTSDQRYLKMLERFRDDLLFCEALTATIGRPVAIIDEETGLQYIILNICRNYTRYQMSRFRLLNEQLFPSMHGWPLKPGAPYRYRFSITLQRLVDSGIIEYLYKSTTMKSIPKSNVAYKDSTKTGTLTMSSCYGLIAVLLCGEVLAIVIFAGEILYFKFFK